PNMATSPDGEVESLFRWGDGSRPRAGERIELKFVAKDTLTGTHYSDTCSYWLTVLADTVPLAPLDTLPLDTLPNDTLIPDSLIYYIPTIFCGRDTALLESVVLSADYTPNMATSPDGEVESLFRWGDGSRPRAGERIELKFVAKDTLTGTHYSDTCSYWLTVLADTSEMIPVDTIPTDTIPLLTPNDSIYQDIEPGILDYIPEMECIPDTTITLSLLLDDFTPRVPYSFNGLVEPLFLLADVYEMKVGDRMRLSFVARDTIDGRNISDTCSYWLYVLADSVNEKKGELICPNDTVIYLAEGECEMNYYALAPICTNRDWEVSLVDGMDGAMMRPNDMQVYSFVAKKDGVKMATCSYQVYVKDSTNAFFKECSENLNFMAMSDTSILNIVLDLPLTDKPCRWDTILMNVEWNSVELSVDTIPIRTSPAWRTISLLPGEYWINWQLMHRGLIVDACESSVRIGVRKMAETRIKDVQLHNYLLTPNGDGRNDLLVLEDLSDYPQNELVIYNQWGSVVYRKRDYDNTWNGFNESSRSIHNGLLPVGTYFYVLFSKNKKVYSGFIELLY
ncbi:MAG: gliding motility-associated C-terminal domain-containing protein, partial [Paludibacteraceae bacterium]|nr:gliding motility-associated C-terminal domain-containing protein [Paludibacteraceae bacterium]